MQKIEANDVDRSVLKSAISRSRRAIRGAMSEWIVNVIMLLFGMSTIVQAYVIPSGSMEGTLTCW